MLLYRLLYAFLVFTIVIVVAGCGAGSSFPGEAPSFPGSGPTAYRNYEQETPQDSDALAIADSPEHLLPDDEASVFPGSQTGVFPDGSQPVSLPDDIPETSPGYATSIALSGVVKNDSNTPVQGAKIEIQVKTTGATLPATVTDAKGYFRFEGLDADEIYRLTFTKETIDTFQRDYSPANNLSIKVYDFAVVKGRVIDNDSEPIAGAVVELRSPNGKQMSASLARRMRDITKPDGTFIVSGITLPGEYQLFCQEISHDSATTPPHNLSKGELWEVDGIVLQKAGAPLGIAESYNSSEDQETGEQPSGAPTVIPLFCMDLSFQRALDSASVSAALLEEFGNHEIKLTQGATIQTIRNGAKWVIDSSGRRYSIEKGDRALNVYR